MTRSRSRFRRAAGLLAAATGAAGLLAAVPAHAAPSLSVAPSTGLNPAGATVTINGSGYTPAQGIYVRFCQQPPGVPGSGPSGRATNCDGTRDQWITPIPASGTFGTTMTLAKVFGTTDCGVVTCGIFTRRDHLGGATDYSSDAFFPVSFSGAAQVAAAPRRALNPAGQAITVTGEGFTPGIGVYVRLCRQAAGALGTPGGRPPGSDCHGPSDLWLTPVPASGTFTTTLSVLSSFGSVNCLQTQCGVFVRRDHLAPTDYSQDAFTPLYFGTALSIGDVTVPEGADHTSRAKVTLTLASPRPTDVTVTYHTVDGTAAAGTDYVARVAKTRTIRAGKRHATISVPILGNTSPQSNRAFTIVLSAPTGETSVLERPVGTVTILDDDAFPSGSLVIGDAKVVESDEPGGKVTARVPVTRTGPVTGAASVTVGVPFATATPGVDFKPLSKTGARVIDFAPGRRTRWVNVVIYGDAVAEGDEILALQLSAPVGAGLGKATGQLTIVELDE
jgi:hypothetical protein